jgi:uncharacterized GH25 family protein
MKPAILILFSTCLVAHDLYLMPQKFRAAAGESILLSAHTGDSFPGSEHSVDPARLTSYPALPEGSWRMLGKATHATVKIASPGGKVYGVATQPRFLEMEAAKFEEYLREEGLAAASALRQSKGESTAKSREMYAKFAKTYVAAETAGAAYRTPLGLKIEFVPQADPAALKPGGELPVIVLFNGQPLAGVQVELALSADPKQKSLHRIAGRTDAQGRLNIAIPAAGKVRLHCVQMERVAQPTHDWESSWASFTFEVPAAGAAASDVISSR